MCVFGHLKNFQKFDFAFLENLVEVAVAARSKVGTTTSLGWGYGECWRCTRRVGVEADDGSACWRVVRWESSFGISVYRVKSLLWTLHRSFSSFQRR